MPGISTPILANMYNTLSGNQNNFSLQEALGGDFTIDSYSQIIKPFLNTKSAPDNLSNEIQTKASTEAVIMILDVKSGVIKYITNKFYLSSMQMSMREKFQLMETFGASNISFFGEAARVYVFSASTIDASSQETGVSQGKYYYQSSILKMYNSVLRGSQLIKDNRIAVMKTNNHLIYGYPLNLQVVYNAVQDPVTTFVLQFVVSEHSLEMPGVIQNDFLESMYSVNSYVNSQTILDFIKKIDNIVEKIDDILETTVDGQKYNSGSAIMLVQNTPYNWYNYQPDDMKTEYAALLSAKVGALQSAFGSELDGEISPLVQSKVPPQTIDRLLALIPGMFSNEETFNLVGNNIKSLSQLKKELIMFKSFRMNRSDTGTSTLKSDTTVIAENNLP